MSQTDTARRTAKPRTFLLLPERLPAVVADANYRRLLARGQVTPGGAPAGPLDRLLGALGLPPVAAGQGALRLWGASGERPAGWVACADPVWLQATLDRVYLHAPPRGDVAPDALAGLYADIDAALFADGELDLAAHGEGGYLRGTPPLATAALPPTALDGERPDAFLPAGEGARSWQALSGEVEMLLHAHAFNAAREAAGRRPLNALWLWGGGEAPALSRQALPPLIGDDDLLAGYWLAAGGERKPWPGTLADCAGGSTVVVAPPEPAFTEFYRLWQQRAFASATLLFADGSRIDLDRGVRRFLRRPSRWLLELAES